MKLINRLKSHVATLKASAPRNSERGLSIIEMVVVIMIIGILMGFLVSRIGGSGAKAKINVSKLTMRTLASTVENEYKMEKNSYPANMQALLDGYYIKEIPKDEFGQQITYQLNEDKQGFKLTAPGASKEAGREISLSFPEKSKE